MENSQSLTHKRQHYNRFAYLLEPNIDKEKIQIEKTFSLYTLAPCVEMICKSSQTSSQVKEKFPTIANSDKNPRRQLKYDLQSPNYELFKSRIDQKPSLNSFIAQTPEKASNKDQFSIYNDISTIQYTKSNQIHTHRNLFQSILEQETQNLPFLEPTQSNHSESSAFRASIQNEEEYEDYITKIKNQQNDLIKLELSESDDEPKESYVSFIKKHVRTMTEGNEDHFQNQKHNNTSTAEKSARFHQFIRKSELESIEVSEPSKDDSIEYSYLDEAFTHKDKRYTGVTTTTLKTKKMSQKLQESSELEYQNSISVILKNSQSSSMIGSHKSIKLGRRTNNKK